MTAGRPTDYKKEYNGQVYKLCLLGAIDKEIADFFDIAESTLNNWKEKFPKFMESIRQGKTIANADVAESLYKRACGYEHKEDKIFNDGGTALIVPTIKRYPPDTGAAMAFLKNRTNNQAVPWSDSQKIEVDAAKEFRDILRGKE